MIDTTFTPFNSSSFSFSASKVITPACCAPTDPCCEQELCCEQGDCDKEVQEKDKDCCKDEEEDCCDKEKCCEEKKCS